MVYSETGGCVTTAYGNFNMWKVLKGVTVGNFGVLNSTSCSQWER